MLITGTPWLSPQNLVLHSTTTTLVCNDKWSLSFSISWTLTEWQCMGLMCFKIFKTFLHTALCPEILSRLNFCMAVGTSDISYTHRDHGTGSGHPLVLPVWLPVLETRVEGPGDEAQVGERLHYRSVGDIKGFHHVTFPFTQYQRQLPKLKEMKSSERILTHSWTLNHMVSLIIIWFQSLWCSIFSHCLIFFFFFFFFFCWLTNLVVWWLVKNVLWDFITVKPLGLSDLFGLWYISDLSNHLNIWGGKWSYWCTNPRVFSTPASARIFFNFHGLIYVLCFRTSSHVFRRTKW